jgi:mannosyltransferase OCH1-like enzyme
VWLTNYSDQVTLSVYVNYLINRLIAPTHEFRFSGDTQCQEFIASQSAEMNQAYGRLQIGAARADLWRIAILHRNGGIYLDVDAALSWPPELLIRDGQTEQFVREKDGRLTNYFIAAAPGHPVLAEIAAKIVANISANRIASIYDMTGPSVINEIASKANVRIEPSRLFCRQGQFTSKTLQYPDKLKGYWAREEEKRPIVAPAVVAASSTAPTP